MTTSKFRFWAFVFYPDFYSVDSLIKELKKLHIDFVCSPCHTPDEEIKKSHYHIVICWSGPTTSNHINENVLGSIDPEIFKNCTLAFPLYQVNGYLRYLTHLDDPGKQQFDGVKPFIYGSTASNQYEEAVAVGDYDRVLITKEICDFVNDNCISEFPDLLEYASNNFPKWAYVLYKSVPDAVKLSINSNRWRFKKC